jgi:hypothetical protein
VEVEVEVVEVVEVEVEVVEVEVEVVVVVVHSAASLHVIPPPEKAAPGPHCVAPEGTMHVALVTEVAFCELPLFPCHINCQWCPPVSCLFNQWVPPSDPKPSLYHVPQPFASSPPHSQQPANHFVVTTLIE